MVVGGGISGLASAIALRQAGWEVRVLERATELREIGAGISLWPNALRALDLLGVGDRVRARGAVEASAGFRDQRGNWLFRSDTRAIEQHYGPTVLIRRADLLAILAGALPPAAVTLSTEVTDVDERADHVQIQHDGGPTTADLVVVADGIWSRIRSRIWPSSPAPRYAGYTTWRFITPVLEIDAQVSESWGRGQRVGIFPFGDGTIYSYLTAAAPPDLRVADELDEVRRRFRNWHEPIPALLSSITSSDVLRHDIYRLPPLPTYVSDRVALVGDAAHAMTPDFGQGGCTSMEDAVELARQLDDAPVDPADGLVRYDRLRRPRTHTIARQSALFAAVAQASTPALAHVRNNAARLLPPAVLMRALRPMLSWR